MPMTVFTTIFLAALLAGLTLQFWLVHRQANHIASNRDAVPPAFADSIALADHQKAADYSQARLRVERVDLIVGALLVLAWTLGGGLDWLVAFIAGVGLDPLWAGVTLLIGVVAISALIDLPIAVWRTFVIEQRFGFNRTTPLGFAKDRLLGLLLMSLLGIPLLAAILSLMTHAGSYWWLWAWLLWMAFSLFITWAYPIWIAPIFNKFEPLQDRPLRTRLEGLLTRCGFRSNGMYVMDGSKRSAHGNAYFTGFGNNKRIVFFDTLLKGLETDEIEAVLAHELGHFKRRHIVKMLALSSLMSLLALALLGWLSQQSWFYAGLGVTQASPAAALTLFMLVLPIFSVFFSPIMARLSRRHEFEADEFAAEQTDARHLISGLVKMYRDNASTLTPDPLYSAFHHSHPPAPIRVAHLERKVPQGA